MVAIASVHGVLAPHRFTRHELTPMVDRMIAPDGSRTDMVSRVHGATGVEARHLALPLAAYPRLAGFEEANDAFIRVGLDLGAAAVAGALDRAGLEPRDVDLIMCASVTGVAVPSLDARLVDLLGLRPDVRRLPVFGLGCVAGAAGVARLRDYLLGSPDSVAVLLCVELCSLTLQRGDDSMAGIVASGLFGDGAAAAVLVGSGRAAALGVTGPRVVASRSRLYPDTQDAMGWEVSGSGFRVVLSADVPAIVAQHVRADVESFLADHGLGLADVATWVSHSGGPRVLRALEDALDLRDGQLRASWRSLRSIGNLSSASVLHVLRDTLAGDGVPVPTPGTPGVLLALGPGFCAELVLLRW